MRSIKSKKNPKRIIHLACRGREEVFRVARQAGQAEKGVIFNTSRCLNQTPRSTLVTGL